MERGALPAYVVNMVFVAENLVFSRRRECISEWQTYRLIPDLHISSLKDKLQKRVWEEREWEELTRNGTRQTTNKKYQV